MTSRKAIEAGLQQGLSVVSRRNIVSAEARAAFEEKVVRAGEGAAGEDTVEVPQGKPLFTPEQARHIAAKAAGRLEPSPVETPVAEPPSVPAAEPSKRSRGKKAKQHGIVISQPELPETKPGTKRNPREHKNGRKTRLTSIHFDTDLLDWLDLAATLRRTTLSHLVQVAVFDMLDKSEIPQPSTLIKSK